jgi:hypothetical protein
MRFSILPAIAVCALLLASGSALPNELRIDSVGLDSSLAKYDCPEVDHHFRHQNFWVAASSTTKCMTLETDLDIIHSLNRLASPRPKDFRRGSSLVCSLKAEQCVGGYSPTDGVTKDEATTFDNDTTIVG